MLPELRHNERAHWYGGRYKYITMLCDACYMAAVRARSALREGQPQARESTSRPTQGTVVSPTTGLGHRLSKGNLNG